MSPKQTLHQLPRPRPAPCQSLAFSLLRTGGGGREGVGVGGYRMGPMSGSQFPGPDYSERRWQGKVSAVGTWCPSCFTPPTARSAKGWGRSCSYCILDAYHLPASSFPLRPSQHQAWWHHELSRLTQ